MKRVKLWELGYNHQNLTLDGVLAQNMGVFDAKAAEVDALSVFLYLEILVFRKN